MAIKPKGLQLARNSEMQDYKKCRLLWHWTWNLKLKPKVAANALRFGNLVHLSMEEFYIPGRKRGTHPAKTFVKLYREETEALHSFGIRDDDGTWTEAEEMGVDMLTHYVEEYGKEDYIEIIAPELPFQVHVYHPKNGKYVVTVVGKLDAVYKNLMTRRYGIIDHKTAATISTSHLTLDEQPGTYWTFAPTFLQENGWIPEDVEIDHILFNFLRKATRDTRPMNEEGLYLNKPTKEALLTAHDTHEIELPSKTTIPELVANLEAADLDPALFGEPSKVQPPAFFHRETVWRSPDERQSILRRIRMQAWEMAQVRAGKLPIYKTPGSHCAWCPMRDPCELEEAGSDWEEMLRLAYVKWDPYSDHEIAREKG